MSLTIDLTQRRALITGVSSGIGAAIAEMLAKAGCDVAGCGSRPVEDAGASNFLATVRAHGRKAHYHSVNLATESGPAECVATAAEALGGIDLVVSNAGRNIFKGAENCTETDWEECMNLDLASHWRLARAAKPQKKRSKKNRNSRKKSSPRSWKNGRRLCPKSDKFYGPKSARLKIFSRAFFESDLVGRCGSDALPFP